MPRDIEQSSYQDLLYGCPRCRARIEVNAGRSAKCSSCGFEAPIIDGIHCFAARDPADKWQQTYEQLAGGPLGHTTAGVQYRSPLQHSYIVRAFSRLCGKLPSDSRVLDVGCGNGLFYQALTPQHDVVGIDYAVGMCVIARARGMITFQADALALPFADEQFDLVYAPEMMQYVADLKALCSELARVCRPHGRIVLSTSNRRSLVRKAMRVIRWMRPHPIDSHNPPIHMRTAGEIVSAARGLPLLLREMCWTHFPFPWLLCSKSEQNFFEPLAANIAVAFEKMPH